MLPWECEDCSYKEVASPFLTFIECPRCKSPNFFHGNMIEEDIEEYNIYDEGEDE